MILPCIIKWNGDYSGKGRPPIYGTRVDYNNIPAKYLKSDETEKDIRTRIYQIIVMHKKFADSLNVVIMIKEI